MTKGTNKQKYTVSPSEILEGQHTDAAANKIGYCTFKVIPSCSAYYDIEEMITNVTVYDMNRHIIAFEGRVIGSTESMADNGQAVYKEVQCESVAGFLCDSILYAEFHQGDYLRTVLQQIIDNHNNMVSDQFGYKQFQIGACISAGLSEYVEIDYDTTFNALQTVFVESQGLEFRVRREKGINYIDVDYEFSDNNVAEIKIGHNLSGLNKTLDMSEPVPNRIFPLGGVGYDGKRLTIHRSPNYIDKTVNQGKRGIICGKIVFDDIVAEDEEEVQNASARLWNKAIAVTNNLSFDTDTYNISAVDLSLAGYNEDIFKVGKKYRIINPLMKFDKTLRLTEMTTDWTRKWSAELIFGAEDQSLSSVMARQSVITNQTLYHNSKNSSAVTSAQIAAALSANLHGIKLLSLTKEDYASLSEKDASTLYIATESEGFRLYFGLLPLLTEKQEEGFNLPVKTNMIGIFNYEDLTAGDIESGVWRNMVSGGADFIMNDPVGWGITEYSGGEKLLTIYPAYGYASFSPGVQLYDDFTLYTVARVDHGYNYQGEYFLTNNYNDGGGIELGAGWDAADKISVRSTAGQDLISNMSAAELHVCAVRVTGGSYSLYIDGALVGSKAYNYPSTYYDYRLARRVSGQTSNSWVYYKFVGLADGVHSAEEIAKNSVYLKNYYGV